MKPSCRLVALCCLGLAGGACVQLGPTVAPPASFNYNEAMAEAWNEQLLLDLVRLRYQGPPFFLEASSVVTGYIISGADSGPAAEKAREVRSLLSRLFSLQAASGSGLSPLLTLLQ